MEAKKGKVCVTGGASFVPSWLIMRLLQRGYSVRATVRSDPKLTGKIAHLQNLEGASERLEIVQADLTKPESFESAIEGCVGVFHLAHPVMMDPADPENMVMRPAIDGTLAILKACLKSKTVKRVVHTSSAVTVIFSGKDVKKMDENLWSDVEICKTLRIPNVPSSDYFVSKILTERAALGFAEEHGLDLVSVIPSLVLGPFLVPDLPPSCFAGLALIRGGQDPEKLPKQMELVHVDDIVSAHIFLFECPEAKGRYICSAVDITTPSLAKFLTNKFPEFKIPSIFGDEEEEKPIQLSSEKLMGLGFKFKYGLDEIYEGLIKCCKEKGIL